MSRMTKLAMAVAVSTAVMAPAAFATNGIIQAGNGMVAHGLGGAGIANAAEATSLADNPALATSLGNQGGVAASLFNPNRSADLSNSPYGFAPPPNGWAMTPGSGYVKSDSEWFFIPQGAYTAAIDNKSSWGIAAYAMGGMNTDYPDGILGPNGTAFMPGGVGVDLSGLIVAPSYAYKVSPTTSVGAALIIGYAQFEERNASFAFGAAAAPGTTKDTSTGFGIKLGVNSEVSKGVNVGFTYQPELNMSDMEKFCDAANNGLFLDKSGKCMPVTLPDSISLGVSAVVGSGKIVADISKYSWAKVDLFEAFGWKNQTVFKAGYEFGAGDVTYRVGFNYGKSPIDAAHAGPNFVFPAITEKHLTVGFSKNMGAGATLTGYYLRALEATFTDDGSENMGGFKDAKIKMDQNALGLGMNWKM